MKYSSILHPCKQRMSGTRAGQEVISLRIKMSSSLLIYRMLHSDKNIGWLNAMYVDMITSGFAFSNRAYLRF